MFNKILNGIIVGLLIYIVIYCLFFYQIDNDTEVKDPNFSLEIQLNGLQDDKEYQWMFVSIVPAVGIVPVDFKTGEINPQKLTNIQVKNGNLKINGRVQEPGLFSLRNIKGKEELIFMLDTCDQYLEANLCDIRKDKYLFGYNSFIYRGSELNNQYNEFWNTSYIQEFHQCYLDFLNWNRKKINELYGLSLEEYNKCLIKGKSIEVQKKFRRNVKQEKSFFKNRKQKQKKINKLKTEVVLQFVEQNPNNRVGLFYLLCYVYILGDEKPDYENMSLYMPLLSQELNTSIIYQYLKEMYKLKSDLQIGKIAPDFTVMDQYGDSLQLSDLRGNYILLEFWKSSCDYCTDEKANMLELYLKYQQKDFEILSISFDTDKKEWLQTLEKHSAPWLQYRDSLGYDESPIIKEYAHAGIPTYILLDKEGKIVAKDLRQPKIAEDKECNLNLQLEKIFTH